MKSFLTGLGTGIALGVLFAPRSGDETRQQLRESADELSGRAREQLGRVQEYTGNLQERARDIGRRATELAEDTRSQLRDTARAVASKAGAGALLRLNTASREELMNVNGIGPVLADRIIEGRPFLTAQQVIDRGILTDSTFKELLREFKAA